LDSASRKGKKKRGEKKGKGRGGRDPKSAFLVPAKGGRKAAYISATGLEKGREKKKKEERGRGAKGLTKAFYLAS